MSHRFTGSTWARTRQTAAAVTLGLLLGACGSPADLAVLTDTGALPSGADQEVGGAPAAPAPDVGGGSAVDSGGGAAADPGAPVADGGTSDGGSSELAFSWTKPAGFDAALAAAIAQQPSFMGGYGGQVTNPFPQLPGSTRFSGMQLTRADAITLGTFFGRPSFRFHVDAASRHSNGLRAEFTGGDDFHFVAGDTYRYEFSTYFPAEYKNSSWTEWNMFAQFHGPGFPAWGLHTAGGYLHMAPPSAAPNQFRIPMPARGRWHDFSWTIHWAGDGSGWATLAVDGEQVFSYRGATMHAGEPYYYPKFGSYLANNPYTQVTYSTPWLVTQL